MLDLKKWCVPTLLGLLLGCGSSGGTSSNSGNPGGNGSPPGANTASTINRFLKWIDIPLFTLHTVRAAPWPEVALLMTIRGVSVMTAFTIMAVIGRIDRFATADSLSNYAGLVPRQRSLAGKSGNGKITKAGSHETAQLRWVMAVENGSAALLNLTRIIVPIRRAAHDSVVRSI